MTLPQHSQTAGLGQSQDDGVIVLGETSKVLGTLLRMIGGLEFPKLKSFDELEGIWLAAEKYDMPGPLAIIRTTITTAAFLEQPLRLYALAARCGWQDEAKVASKHTLGLSIYDQEHSTILERVPSEYVLRLLRLHRKRRDDFRELIEKNNFGISSCICGSPLRKGALANIEKLLIMSMDLRPDGRDLLDGKWKAWTVMSEPSCNQGWRHCSATVANHQDRIAACIANSLNSLPCTI